MNRSRQGNMNVQSKDNPLESHSGACETRYIDYAMAIRSKKLQCCYAPVSSNSLR
jgi:hypothetical protein